MSTYKILALHDHPEFIEDCIDVLGEEWPRSRSARRLTLEKSNKKFPNLVFIKDDQVTGHSMLSQVLGVDDACFVESVVVSKKLRGQGLGRILMTETEEYARSLGIKTIYLTTHDKQGFYERVGYTYCEPVCTFSGKAFMNNPKISQMLEKMAVSQMSVPSEQSQPTGVNDRVSESEDTSLSILKPVFPVPPPPPPPVMKPMVVKSQEKISWMKKELMPS